MLEHVGNPGDPAIFRPRPYLVPNLRNHDWSSMILLDENFKAVVELILLYLERLLCHNRKG
jgi:hypothetical protein